MAPQRNWLKLTSLKFISPVDVPAQETATAVLLKRGGEARTRSTSELFAKGAEAKVVKLSNDELGLVFGWALTTKSAGVDYFDLHGDNIVEDDLIKVALEWMSAGAKTDTMHNREEDGWAPFCMPMTASVAKAFGIPTDTHGIMIAMKPSPEVFAKFKSGELTGFSIDGTGYRTPVDKARTKKSAVALEQSFVKATLVTDEVEGHAHTVEICEDGDMWTSWATAEGAANGHQHAVALIDGAIQILADSGHSHVLAAGQAGVVLVPTDAIAIPVQASAKSVSPTTNDVAAKNAAPKSTPSAPLNKVDSTMKTIVLTEAQHAHYSKLASADAEAFIAKSASERDSEVQKAKDADPIVYKTESGIEVRKSHGDVALMLAKQADESAKLVSKATEIANVEKALREHAEITKAATETLGNLAGTTETHVALMKAVRSISDEKVRGEVLTSLKAADDAAKSFAKAKGFGGSSPTGESPFAKFQAGLVEFAKSVNKSPVDATAQFLGTSTGAELYAATQAPGN
jgi:hypothetical protein